MKIDKICRETLESICRSEDISNLSDVPEHLKDHLSSCKQCGSYRQSLLDTIGLYRKYDIKLEQDIKKKLICKTCEKLKNDIEQ